MKLTTNTLPVLLALTSLFSTLPAMAQQTPPAAAPPPAPLLPPPAPAGTPPEAPLGPFKDQKERQSYGLGTFLGNREKQNALSNPEKPTVNADELLAGLKDGMDGAKSIDYAGGLAMAAQIKRSGVEVDYAVLAEAIRASVENKTPKVAQQDIQAIMQEIQTQIQSRQAAKVKAEADKNLAAATSWLAENGKKEGIKTTASGLQYQIEKPGEGRTPGPRDVATVNLTGTVAADGAEFDRTAEGTPARRSMMALPKGLQEGLQLLKAGGKAKFWLPPALGYGESPRAAAVRPNSVLAYTVELISSEEPPANQPANTLGPDGQPLFGGKREPVTAVTPPVSVEIPAGGGAPKIKVEGQPDAPKAPPAPPAAEVKPPQK